MDEMKRVNDPIAELFGAMRKTKTLVDELFAERNTALAALRYLAQSDQSGAVRSAMTRFGVDRSVLEDGDGE